MNAAEHIVEAYFRYCRSCFTITDQKVPQGNNRQFDMLAYSVKTREEFHIEVSVTHRENWCPTLEDLDFEFERKFFGAPPKRPGAGTDYTKNKDYFSKIEDTYADIGFTPSNVKRVWVCWIVNGVENNSEPLMRTFKSKHLERSFQIEILSLRDCILPALTDAIGTSNYDDEILRTIAFIKQCKIMPKG